MSAQATTLDDLELNSEVAADSAEFESRRSRVMQAALAQGLFDAGESTLAAFIDLDGVESNIASLLAAFPVDARIDHAFAAKANPLPPLLNIIREAGMHCEVASPGELGLAAAAGFDPGEIVYDAPAKRSVDIKKALELGVRINVDNLTELEKLAEQRSGMNSTSQIGVRVNPQIGAGTIASTSTASSTSKFGVPIGDADSRAALLEAYAKYPWLQMVHVHVGSQGMGLDLVAQGIGEVVKFADEIDAYTGREQIQAIDIGGGLAVDFTRDYPANGDFASYVAALTKRVPNLFDGRRSLLTEFGRSIVAKHGFTASFVESTKEVSGRKIALTYAGAHVAARTVYQPETWPLRVSALDGSGQPKRGAEVKQDVAGPLCFAGDVVAWQYPLPELESGDIVLLLDTGGYYSSSPYGYNSMPEPGVYGYRFDADGAVSFTTLREEQTVEQLVAAAIPAGGVR